MDEILATIPVAEYRKMWGAPTGVGIVPNMVGVRSVIFTTGGIFVLNLGYKTSVMLRGNTAPTEMDVNDSPYGQYLTASVVGKQQVIDDSKQKIDALRDKSNEYILGLNKDNFYWSYSDIDRILRPIIGNLIGGDLVIWPQKDNHSHYFDYRAKGVDLDPLMNFIRSNKQYNILTDDRPKFNLLIKMLIFLIILIAVISVLGVKYAPYT